MHATFRLVTALVLAALLAPFGMGQTPPPVLEEKEIEELGKKLAEWTEKTGSRRESRAKDAFFKELEDVEERLAGKVGEDRKKAALLSDVTSWAKVFQTAVGESKPRSAGPKGRVKSYRVGRTVSGATIGFEYAVRLPRGYDSRRAWPLILSLPDRGQDGDDHLKETWDDVAKEVVDQFVILAPTVGEKTLGRARDIKRISWMDMYHRFAIFLPLREVLSEVNIDTNRIYLDGVGYGGKTALHLGALRTKVFAAVAARHCSVERPAVLTNLGRVPVRIAGRRAWFGGEGAKTRSALEAVKQQAGLDLDFLEYDPASDTRRGKGEDPIPEASEAIGRFFAEHDRNPYPSELSFTTDQYAFSQTSWVWIENFDVEPDLNIFPALTARADRATNTIDVKAENIEIVRILVNDALVDLDKPVKININGELVKTQQFERSLDFLLNFHQQNRFDPSFVMSGVVRLNVPRKQAEEDKKEQ